MWTLSVLTQIPARRAFLRTSTASLGPVSVMATSSGLVSGRGASRFTAPNSRMFLPSNVAVMATLSSDRPTTTSSAFAAKLAQIPLTQLMAMKLIVNQAYDNMGLQSTQTLGPILDGIMRNTPEGRDFVRVAKDQGVKAAVTLRDAPFNDYSRAPRDQQPRKKSELGA